MGSLIIATQLMPIQGVVDLRMPYVLGIGHSPEPLPFSQFHQQYCLLVATLFSFRVSISYFVLTFLFASRALILFKPLLALTRNVSRAARPSVAP